jgi:hypothetical protein
MLRLADNTTTTFNELLDTVVSTESITVSMLARGGFVARLINLNPSSIIPAVSSSIKGALRMSTFRWAGETFVLPGEYQGKSVSISLYNLNGKMLKMSTFSDKRSIHLKKDFGIPSQVCIIKLEQK